MSRYLAALILAIVALPTSAATIVIPGDPNDGQVDVNGVPVDLTDTIVRPGTGGGSQTTVVRGQATIYFFALPLLSPNTISNASIRLSFAGLEASPDFDLDLFGLGVRSSPTILAGDYYAGNAAGGSGTLLEAGMLTPSSAPGTLFVGLSAYLPTLYDQSGIPLDSYLVLRANPSIVLPSPNPPIRGYYLATGDNLNPSLVPELTIDTIPEPSTLTLAAFGIGVLLGVRVRFWKG